MARERRGRMARRSSPAADAASVPESAMACTPGCGTASMAPPPSPDWRAWHLRVGLVQPAVGLESSGEARCGGEACQSARVAGYSSGMVLCWLAEMTSASQPCLGPAVTRRATRELTQVLQCSYLGSMCQLNCAY
jgi:hypothetical protein